MHTLAEENRILEVLTGSRAYGFNNPDSDYDSRGIFIANPRERLGFAFPIEQAADEKQDRTLYEIKKFFKLASECNPNIIELIFTHPDDIQFITPLGELLIQNRDIFISKKAKHTFSGYAFSQLQRIKGHNKRIMKPQSKESPRIEDYFVTKSFVQICAEENLQEIEFVTKKGMSEEVTYFNKEGYKAAYREWRQYWDWKNNRNEVRAELEQNHGFDTKHACHLIRLLRMGKEILSGEGVLVRRPDAEELRAIRNGAYSYEKILEMSEKLEAELNELYEKSTLQRSPDIEKLNDLLIEITNKAWNGKL